MSANALMQRDAVRVSHAAMQAMSSGPSYHECREYLLSCRHWYHMPICRKALKQTAHLGLLTGAEITATVQDILCMAACDDVPGAVQMLFECPEVDRLSALQTITTAGPANDPGALYTWERVDALVDLFRSSLPWPAMYPPIQAYLRDAWGYYAEQRGTAAPYHGARQAEALAALVPLTTGFCAAAEVCPENVLALMVSGDLMPFDGYDVLHGLWGLASHPTRACMRSSGFLCTVMAHLGRLPVGADPAPGKMAALVGALVARQPVNAARYIVRYKAWIVLEDVELPDACTAAMAGPLALLLWERDVRTYDRDPLVIAANTVLDKAFDASLRAGLYTATCCLYPDQDIDIGEYTEDTAHTAFHAAWRSASAADRLEKNESVLLQFEDRRVVDKVSHALAFRHGRLGNVPSLLVAYDRARAWQRRKAFVMCAALAAPTTRKRKRKRGGPACPWAALFGFTRGAGDELGLQLTQAVGVYL